MAGFRERFFPEQGNRQPPRGMREIGGLRLGISAPPRTGGAIAPERPTAPTLPPPDTRQPAPDTEPKKPKKHTARNIALAGGSLFVAGLGAYQTVPAIHRLVDSAFLDHLKGSSETSTVNPVEVFDNAVDKQTVKAGVNARPISQNEALALAKDNPPQLHEGDFPTLPLIFIGKLTNGGEAIIETSYTDQAYNPIAHKPDRLNTGKYVVFTKADTELAITLEEFEVFQVDPFVYKDNLYFAGVVLRFNDPDGVQYTMSIQAPEDIRHLAPTEIIKNAPTVGENGKYLGNKHYEKIKNQKGLIVQGGIPILRTTEDNTRVRISAGPILDEFPKGLPARISFITQDNQMVFPQ